MQQWIPLVVTSVVSVLASSGFWAWMSKRDNTKSASSRLLKGFAYNQIANLGMTYVERGSVSRDEYEDLVTLWYEPYKQLGGNGLADRIMEEVRRLPLTSHERFVHRLGRGFQDE